MVSEEHIRFIYDEAAAIISTGGIDYLVVGDLHIGAERAFIKRGIRMYGAIESMVKKIKKLAREFNTKNIIILGDVKDTVLYPDAVETNELKMFFRELADYKIIITAGNHDPHLKEIVNVEIVDELCVGDFAFLHGHRWPSDKAMVSKFIFAGHNHIAVNFKDKRGGFYNQKAWLVSKVNKKKALERYPNIDKDITLVVLPAFNDLIVGMPVNRNTKDNLSPLFRNGVFNYKSAKVYSLRGEILGAVSKIKKIK